VFDRLRKTFRRQSRHPVAVTHHATLAPDCVDDELVSVSVGPDGEAIAVWAAPDDASALLDRTVAPDGVSSVDDRLAEPVTVRVATHAPHLVRTVWIADFRLAFPLAQPLPDGKVLVVGPRVRWDADSTPANTVIYDGEGRQVAQGLFGDGIEQVLATPSGHVWVGYSDEGIYGNLGWNDAPNARPIGAAGLLRFSPDLQVDWQFCGPVPIDDCYALNVVGETAWTCYYSDFPVVEARMDVVRSWRNTTEGARALAIHDDWIALYGDYDEPGRLMVAKLGPGKLMAETEFRLTLPNGDRLPDVEVVGRGSTLHLFVGRDWYRLDLAELIS
jgi:hypothetical protein